jgi:glyoxylase I family protein
MLNTAYDEGQRPAVPDAQRVAGHSHTAPFSSCPDVDGAYAYLREKGVAKKPPTVARYAMKQLYVTEPDGYGLCFQWPLKEQAKSSA